MILLAPLLLAAAPAEAQPDCARKDLPLSELELCAAAEFRAADAAFKEQWERTAKLMKMMDGNIPPDNDDGRPSYYQSLLESQRGWLLYRDGQCAAESEVFHSGTMSQYDYGMCMARLTRARTAELQSLYAGERE